MTHEDDIRHFAKIIVRDSGSCALEIVQGRVRVLEREGRHSVAKLWREIEAVIEKLPALER